MQRAARLAPKPPFLRRVSSPLVEAIREACENREQDEPARKSDPPVLWVLGLRPYAAPRIEYAPTF